jgi:hypothetical protein
MQNNAKSIFGIFANSNPNSKRRQPVNQGTQGVLCAKKTKGSKSRETVPLKQMPDETG